MQVLEIEIKNYYTLYSRGWMPQSHRAVSQGKELEAIVMNTARAKEKITSVVSEIVFLMIVLTCLPTFCIGIFSNLRVWMLLKKEYIAHLISHFGKTNKRSLNPCSTSFAMVQFGKTALNSLAMHLI